MKELEPPWTVKREVVIKSEAETNPKYGYQQDKRPLPLHITYGYLNLDKPKGPSSHEVTAWVKKILGVGRAGHSGTLEV